MRWKPQLQRGQGAGVFMMRTINEEVNVRGRILEKIDHNVVLL